MLGEFFGSVELKKNFGGSAISPIIPKVDLFNPAVKLGAPGGRRDCVCNITELFSPLGILA
jgi:hypothetical protein